MKDETPQSIVSRFLTFDTMIGGSLIQFIYFAGLVGIGLYALVILIGGLGMAALSPVYALGGILGAVAMLIVGTVFWRFSCELWMLLFRIHDLLRDIRDRSAMPAARGSSGVNYRERPIEPGSVQPPL